MSAGFDLEALQAWLAQALGCGRRIARVTKLGGGAIQENWRLDFADGQPLVLRTEAVSTVPLSRGKAEEFAIHARVFAQGLTVPRPLALCAESQVIGRLFYLMEWRPGEARGRTLVLDPEIDRWGPPLARRLGEECARLHRLAPPLAELGFLAPPEANPAQARVRAYRRHLAERAVQNPVLDLALAWLDANAPEPGHLALVHGDLRTGNYLVHQGILSAILDWEFADIGDPLEDLGWFLVRYWRFGRWHAEAGALGPKSALLEGYREAGGVLPDDPAVLTYWQLMGTVRWAVIALMQAERHDQEGEPSLDLALTGAVLPQLEWDILDLIEVLDGAR